MSGYRLTFRPIRSARAQEAFKELTDIYHAEGAITVLRPPLGK